MKGLKRLIVFGALVGVAWTAAASSQTLPDSLIQRIRAGASRIVVPGDSVVLPLVGAPTLPLAEYPDWRWRSSRSSG